MLGSVDVNTILTFGVILVVLVAGMIADVSGHRGGPDPARRACWWRCWCRCSSIPVTYTVWGAIDLAMHPLQPAEVDDAARAVASGRSQPEKSADGT